MTTLANAGVSNGVVSEPHHAPHESEWRTDSTPRGATTDPEWVTRGACRRKCPRTATRATHHCWVSEHGVATEQYVRRLAARLGVPDFVYEPTTVVAGSRSREISDGLLVAGRAGLVLQIKSREREAAARDSEERAASWVRKQAEEATGQARGTLRELSRNPDVTFESMRGYRRSLPPSVDWRSVVLVDHPHAPAIHLPDEDGILYLTMTDWLELHDRVRSTAAVINYVQRALEVSMAVPLGREQLRYERLARADDGFAARAGGLPTLPLGRPTSDQASAIALFDELVEKVADSTNQPWDENSYLPVVELLDRQPILLRLRIGSKMVSAFKKLRVERRPQGFGARDALGNDRFVFYYDLEAAEDPDDYDENHVADIAALGTLRHTQARESGAADDSATLSIGIRHHEARGRRASFALIQGAQPPMDASLRRSLEADHGIYDESRARTIPLVIGRNERCPCGSGRKFKVCCLRRTG
jgi:hypothetical protein